METSLTLKEVERVKKIRKRERSKALDNREVEELRSQISNLQDIKNDLVTEKLSLNRECELYRIRMFLDSPQSESIDASLNESVSEVEVLDVMSNISL